MEQIDLFEALYEKPKLPSKVRLIEFFAGIGAQAKALKILGADFEHWRTCEWSWQSITAYNAIHMNGEIADTSDLTYEEVLGRIRGVSANYNEPMGDKQLRAKGEPWARELLGRMIANRNVCPDVSRLKAKDLGIRERERYCYVLTYSFPCQDLSLAGKTAGMEKGSGTRSGLLWEVERILLECKDMDCLPQVLIMENVPQVCGAGNIEPWADWLQALGRLGYANHFRILNAKDYGIPQNRRRCFMVSILGESSYTFPRKSPLKYRLKDFIEKKVDERYYLSEKIVEGFRAHTERHKAAGDGFRFEPAEGEGVSHSVTTKCGQRPCDSYLKIPSATKKGYMEAKDGDGVLPTWKGARGTVQDGMSPTLLTDPDTIGVVLAIPCSRDEPMEAREGDSVGITFMKSGNTHTPVTEGVSRTITTMSDHDIGVVVKEGGAPNE